jgi:hypothetical protein
LKKETGCNGKPKWEIVLETYLPTKQQGEKQTSTIEFGTKDRVTRIQETIPQFDF